MTDSSPNPIPQRESIRSGNPARALVGWLVLLASLAVLAATLFAYGTGVRPIQTMRSSNAAPPEPPTADLNLIKPLTPSDALAQNLARPGLTGPIEAQRAFLFPAGDPLNLSRRKAIDCLTAAIYYESASETAQGQRAVAQVVLNRVLHPSYPKSVCGVVYQGSERATGCQFTFTCDGSLRRPPSQRGWEAARVIAEAVLAGRVERSVGTATNYHTVFVVPYWASSLQKIATVGSHIFYRYGGLWGKRAAFTGSYAGESALESDPLIAAEAIIDEAAGTKDVQTSDLIIAAPGTLVVPVASRLVIPPQNSRLRVDESRGQLKVDEVSGTEADSSASQAP